MKRYQPRHAGTDSDRLGSWFSAVLWLGLVVAIVSAGFAATKLVRADPGTATMEDAQIAGPTPGADADADAEVPLVERPEQPANAPATVALPPSAPTAVEIPAIGVRSGLESLALDADGVLIAPTDYDVAGWFAAGTQPGQPGPAVIAGHVDSDAGPAVFYRLEELVAGDEVLVEREDGQVVRFVVREIQRHPKDAFPAEVVYGPVPGPELRLVTCDGVFDRTTNSYDDNLIVFAVAADRPQLG